MGNIKVRGRALLCVSHPPKIEQPGPTVQRLTFWQAFVEAIATSVLTSQMIEGITCSYDVAEANVFVPYDWTNDRIHDELLSIANATWAKVGMNLSEYLVDGRVSPIHMRLTPDGSEQAWNLRDARQRARNKPGAGAGEVDVKS